MGAKFGVSWQRELSEMRLPLKLVASVFLTVALTVAPSSQAHALGPVGIEVGAKVGYGASPGGGAVNPLGAGFGLRAGITFVGIYVGADVVDYLGSGDGNGGQYHAFQYGGELGYGFKVGSVTIRPQVGAGGVYLFGSLAGLTSPAIPTAVSPYVEPGALVFASFGIVYIGVDAGALVLVSEPAYVQTGSQYTLTTGTNAGFTAHGQIGLKF